MNRPGRYAIEADFTVTGAISLAGGLDPLRQRRRQGAPDRAGDGKTTIIEVSLKAVRNGKKPDVPLLPNDVISVSRRVF